MIRTNLILVSTLLAVIGCDASGDEPSCGGTVAQCSSFTDPTECSSQPLCEPGGCGGLARSCGFIDTWEPCLDHDGCTWEGTADIGYCTGTAKRCNEYDFSWGCAGQDGCFWDESICQGELPPCNEIGDRDICEEVIGCDWG